MAERARRGKTRSVRRLLLAVLIASFAAITANADDATRLRIEVPAAAESTVSLPLVEVRGQATARGARVHELVIVLDASDSSQLPSGWDLDGRPANVLAAEIAATRALLERLEAGPRYRVGLVAFSDTAQVLAKVGSSAAELDAALDALPKDLSRHLRGTNFGDAVATAQLALQPETNGVAQGPPAGTAQSILLLTDGVPTLPPHGDRARQHALYAASAAGAAGIRLFTFDLSRDAKGGSPVLAEMAARSDGRFQRLARPGDAIAELRRTDLAGLEEVRVVNETTGAPARALRTFPDGTFDGFVEVAPGRNRIVFRATTSDGASAVAERMVVRTGGAGPADAAALMRELRKRTRETELWAEMERERRTQKLDLDVQIEAEPQDLPK